MSFLIAKVQPTSHGVFQFLDTRKARLAGPDGPIAQKVLSLPESGAGDWLLTGAEIARAISPAEWADWPAENLWLLWDEGSTPFRPLRVNCIPGMSSDFSTDIIVQMEFLAREEEGFRPMAKQNGEALGITGGKSTPKAAWSWVAPKMTLGSTTV